MKKLFGLAAMFAFGFYWLQGGGSDGHVQSAGFALPTLGVGRITALMDRVTAMMSPPAAAPSPLPAPAATADGGPTVAAQPAPKPAAARPASAPASVAPQVAVIPGVITPGSAGMATAGSVAAVPAQEAPAATKGSDFGNVPLELVRFMTPSLLTRTPADTRNLSPAAQATLQHIIAQARANPAAFREQLGAAGKASRGP